MAAFRLFASCSVPRVLFGSTVQTYALRGAACPQTRLYHEKVIDHFENPRNVGSLDGKKKEVGTGVVGKPACGDVMKLQILVDEKGIIVDAKFKTFGCGSAIASSSLAIEKLLGKTIQDAMKITNADIASELKLPPVKLHCSMLAEDAIKSSIKDFLKKNNRIQEFPELEMSVKASH